MTLGSFLISVSLASQQNFIHEKSTFTDPTYIVQQVYRLTNISYRTFKSSQLPVSLLYASFITDQLNKLNSVPGWNPLFIKPLRNKKWFL